MLLIGITGAKGSGKGTVAEFVAKWANQRGALSVDRGFADKLKWAMARIFWPEISMEDAIEWANKFKNEADASVELCAGKDDLIGPRASCRITGRQLFQHGGTEMGREIFGDNFWIDQLLPPEHWEANFFGSVLDEANIATVSDLRFENEALRIKDLGGMIWHVDRPGFEPDGHASEKPFPARAVDTFIYNIGSLDTLRGEVDAACNELVLEKLRDERMR